MAKPNEKKSPAAAKPAAAKPAEKKPAAAKPADKPAVEKKPAAAKAAKAAKKPPVLDAAARTLGEALRRKGNVLQIDLGYFDLKQDGAIVGQVVVSPYINGVIIPGTTMEYYYLYVAADGPYAKFTWPSEYNTPESIEYVWQAGGPGPDFDPVAYQYQQPVANQLIACTCVDCGVVQP